MKKTLLWLLLTCFLMAASVGTVSAATPLVPCDVGNNYDYDGGYDDWGSGGWDWSSDDNDSDSGNQYYFFSGTDSDDDGDGGTIVVAIIIVVVIVALGLAIGSKRGGSQTNTSPSRTPTQTGAQKPQNHEGQIVPAVQAVDPDFSQEKFLAWTKEVFITLQQAWTARDWSRIRPFEKEELFRQHEQQLQEYIQNGTINVVERIGIKQTYLHYYERTPQYEYMKVYMEARMNDYIIDEKTRAVVKGDKDREAHMSYLLTFMRKTGVLTNPATSNKSTVSCPHCGAPVTVTSAGKCEYCDFIITTGEHDWVLSDLSRVRPGDSIDERGVVIRE